MFADTKSQNRADKKFETLNILFSGASGDFGEARGPRASPQGKPGH